MSAGLFFSLPFFTYQSVLHSTCLCLPSFYLFISTFIPPVCIYHYSNCLYLSPFYLSISIFIVPVYIYLHSTCLYLHSFYLSISTFILPVYIYIHFNLSISTFILPVYIYIHFNLSISTFILPVYIYLHSTRLYRFVFCLPVTLSLSFSLNQLVCISACQGGAVCEVGKHIHTFVVCR